MPQIDSHGRKVYGPTGNKGRRKMSYYREDGVKTTTTYAKWLMEEHLGRLLAPHETVDHINRDYRDDRIENLRVVPRGQHIKDDARRVRMVEITCAWCKGKAMKVAREVEGNAKQNKAGPFCGKYCVSKYVQHLMLGGEQFKRTPTPPREYYRNQK